MVHSNIGPVIVDLIEELEIQLDQELYSYYNTDSPKPKPALPATAPIKSLKASISDEKVKTVTKSTSAGTTSINKTKSPTSSKINVQVIRIWRKRYYWWLLLLIYFIMYRRIILNLRIMEKDLPINQHENYVRSLVLRAANWILDLRDKRWSQRSWLFKNNRRTRRQNLRNRQEKMRRRLILIQIFRH